MTVQWNLLVLVLVMQSLWLSATNGQHYCFKQHRNGLCSGKLKIPRPTEEKCCSRSGVVASYPELTWIPIQNGNETKFKCTPCDKSNPVNRVNGDWERWSACSVTCGTGVERRQRICDDPAPVGGRRGCQNGTGTDVEDRRCYKTPCTVDGNWGRWGCWSECSRTCGGGNQYRNRMCDNPPAQHNGKQCVGDNQQEARCNTQYCPENGQWAAWLEWFPCSRSCAGGYHFRVRLCDSPKPTHGGYFCPGEGRQDESCNTHLCPVNGEWGHWSPYSRCSVTCGDGIQTRNRRCEGPFHNGKPCVGDSATSKPCHLRECAIHGGWSPWSDWSACSVTCESGKRTRRRECNNPRPAHGGRYCPDNPTSTEVCDTEVEHCPVDGGWSNWTPWYACSARQCSPSGGYRIRAHYCNNPAPKYNGKDCPGAKAERIRCFNNVGCKMDGGWCGWKPWGECADGVQLRVRKCECPSPANGGKLCTNERRRLVLKQSESRSPCRATGSNCGSGAGSSGDGGGEDDEDCNQGGSGSGSGSGSGAE